MNYVTYDEFKKMDMRIGLIRFVEPVEGTDKLLRFEIDFGVKESSLVCTGTCTEKTCDHSEDECKCETDCVCIDSTEVLPFEKEVYKGRDMRQIVSGIKEFFPEYKDLEGKHGLYILNLEPREIRGVMSYGMLMAVDGVDGAPVFLGPQGEIDPGSKIR